jgi:hypothetical protein
MESAATGMMNRRYFLKPLRAGAAGGGTIAPWLKYGDVGCWGSPGCGWPYGFPLGGCP